MNSPSGPSPNFDPPDSFLTLAGPSEIEVKVQRSRFIGLAFPVETDEAVRERLDEMARKWHGARHVCYGYRLGIGPEATTRRSDDGEPSGTAGEPILTAIGKHEVTDALVVVIRYFGGIKLGTGGLARAYGEAADQALTRARTQEIRLGREFILTFAYPREKTIRRLLESHGGRPVEQQYGEEVTWRIWLAHSAWREFAAHLTEATAGSAWLHAVQPPAD